MPRIDASAVEMMTYQLKQNLKQPLENAYGEKGEEKRRCSINLRESQWELLDKVVEENNHFSSRNDLLRHVVEVYDSLQTADVVEIIEIALIFIESEEDRKKLLELQAEMAIGDGSDFSDK